MLKFLIGAAAAFALLAATPAAACEDCKHCQHGKKETAAATEKQKGTMVAEEKKEEHKGCGCDHSASKECKCGEKCSCASCPVHGKKGEKKEEQKKT